MAHFAIKSADGQQTRYTGCPVYHGSHLKPAYIEFREIASPVIIPWQIGDYVDYTRTGFRYKLYSVPQPTKQAVSGAAGDSFVYKDVQFYCATKDLEIAPFRDLVFADNRIHFTTLQNVSTYEDVFGIALRIQANLDSFYGAGTWNIQVFDTADPDLRAVLLETKEFSISEGSCLDALSQIYSLWKGIGWIYSVVNGVNTITIGRPNVQDRDNTTSVFAYGMGNGIRVLKKEVSGKNELATRIYAYGSTRNLITRYYNNITPSIKDNQSVYIPNLMIPLSHWGETESQKDASKAYLEASGEILAKYGLRPKTIYFDGTGDYEEIYPSVEGLTAGAIRAAMQSTDEYYPDSSFAPDSVRVDEIVSAENPSDNGVLSTDTGGKYVQSVNVLGVNQDFTYVLERGQDSAKISLENISIANTITASGKVTVTPNFHAYINPGVRLGALGVHLWLEIGGKKYAERNASSKIGKNGVYEAWLNEPFDIVTEDTGTVMLKGYIYLGNSAKDERHNVVCNIAPGTTTLAVQITPTDTFKVQIRQIGFDISKQQSAPSDGLCTIAFKSGWCAGREFTVKKVQYVEASDRWELTVARHNDESIGQYFPNNVYGISVGDRFVLTDLTMPEIYITSAMERLYIRTSEVLAALSTPKYVYEPEIDAKVLARNPETILEGMYMPLLDTDVVGDEQEFVLIDTIEINEGEYGIPTYKVTLQDEKRESFLAKLTRESGRNTRNIYEIELRDLRTDVVELTPSVDEAVAPSVEVVASHPIIGYEHSFDENPVNVVTLTCQTTGIDNPTYQWYYLGPIDWVAISGATAQAYVVDPDSELYYLDGEIVEDFMCIVLGDPTLSGSVQIMKVLSSALTFSLSNPSHVFKAGDEYAIADSDTSDVLGYCGVERIATNVKQSAIRFLNTDGTVIPATYSSGNLLDSTGKKLTTSDGKYLVVAGAGGAAIYDTDSNLMMSVEVVNNNTDSAYLSVAVTDKMNIPVGKIEIPIIIKEAEGSDPEKVVKLYYSWALALKGDSPLIADITNEADGVAVGSDGKLSATVTLTTQVILYYGMNAETLSSVVPTVPSAYVSKISSVSTVINTGGKSATVTFTLSGTTANPIDYTGINQIDVPIAVTGARGTRNVTFSIIIVKEGEDGAVFTLVPSADVIKGARNNDNTITYDQTGITCSRMLRRGFDELSPSTYGVLKMSVDGGATKIAYAAITNDPDDPGYPDANWTALIAAGKVIYYWFSDNAETTLIDRETIPVVVDGAKGDNGYSASTIYLYKRSSNGMSTNPNDSNYVAAPGNTVYTFASGALVPASGASLNGWQTTIPSGDDPCYVIMYFAQDNAATKNIPGGYQVNGGSWASPTRLTGDNGLMGKVMRGINEFSTNGLPSGRPNGQGGFVAGYQGMLETDPSIIYYDMVYITGSNGTRTYYYCKNGVGAKDHTPGDPNDSQWGDYWVVATQFDFIATRVLLASNAAIDILSGNAVYMYDDGQSYIVAGVQGGSTTTENVSQVNFFAGTHPETSVGAGDAVTPLTAPFRVTYNGIVYCKDIRISGGEIQISDANDAVVFSVSNTGAMVAANATITGGSITIKDGNNVEVFKVSNTGALTAANATITGGSISIKNGNNVEVFKVSSVGKLTASDVEITGGSIRVSGTAGQGPDGNNYSIMTDGGILGNFAFFFTYANNAYQRYVAINNSSQQNDALEVYDNTGNGALNVVGASSFNGAVNVQGNVTLGSSYNNKIGTEHIISSPTTKHFVDIEESDYDALEQAGTLDANTTYFVYPDGSL